MGRADSSPRGFFVNRKPLAGRVVQKSLSDKEDKKTPFAV
jgi:hypothetical protein